jgi:hypothetical protein
MQTTTTENTVPAAATAAPAAPRCIHATALEARIVARNRAHAEAIKLHAVIAPIFAALVGRVLFKSGGGFLAKVAKLLPEMPWNENGLRIYHESGSNYRLAWVIKCSESYRGDGRDPGYTPCCYEEASCTIGEISNDWTGQTPSGILKNISPPPAFRTDYTAAEIIAARAKVKVAEEALSDAKSGLEDFGEYDR